MNAQPFTIAIPQADLDDVQARLARTRWPDEIEHSGWEYGANRAVMRELVEYWQHSYDWRAHESQLNQLPHFRAEIDGAGMHFIHARGRGPNPTPIVISHGWPGSFYEIVKLIGPLTDPAAYGGDPADSFDVVIPSLPGYGFSDRPSQPGASTERAANIIATLMTDVLGYQRFGAAGGDFGAIVSQHLAATRPELLIGLHLTYIGFYAGAPDPATLSAAERAYMQRMQEWRMREGGYFMIQSTKPQTLAYALNDSPVGLAGWLAEKFYAWTDNGGRLDGAVSKDELLTNVMIYWLTETINSSMRTYKENRMQLFERLPDVPAAFASFPKDINPPPREWVARRVNLQHWTEMPRGGHFAAMEQPELLAADMRAFFHSLRG